MFQDLVLIDNILGIIFGCFAITCLLAYLHSMHKRIQKRAIDWELRDKIPNFTLKEWDNFIKSEDLDEALIKRRGLRIFFKQQSEKTDYDKQELVNFLREHINLFTLDDWIDICMYASLSTDILEEFKEYFEDTHWRYVAQRQNLSESFARRYIEKLKMFNICRYQYNFSEEFFREFIYLVQGDCWVYIIHSHNVSEQFRKDYLHLIFIALQDYRVNRIGVS